MLAESHERILSGLVSQSNEYVKETHGLADEVEKLLRKSIGLSTGDLLRIRDHARRLNNRQHELSKWNEE
jgi:hypothetical protein